MYNRGPNIDTRSVVFNLIAINVFIYGVTSLLPGIFPSTLYDRVISPALMFLGVHYPTSEFFRPFQIVTHMFMHEGIGHIFFNMVALYIFGSMLERFWGQRRFLEFYLMTGLGATILDFGIKALQIYNIAGTFVPPMNMVYSSQQLFSLVNATAVGASGAIFGLQAAFMMYFPNTELMLMFIPVPIKAKYLLGAMFFGEVVFGFANNPSDTTGHFAHIGGALTGYIIVKIWNRNRTFLF